jgi:hypothetical protein
MALAVTFSSPACSTGPGTEETAGEEESGTGSELGWIELHDGCDLSQWDSIAGESITVLAGGQGLLMFALPIRVGEVEIDTSITEWDDPNIPKLNFSMFVDGHDYRPDGSMIYFANYPLRFTEVGDGVYEWVFLPVFVPDEVAPPDLIDGLSAHIELSLRMPKRGIDGGAPLTAEIDTTIVVNDPIDPDDLCGS